MTDQTRLRAAAHTRLRRELDRQGPLHRHELLLLLDAADALFFDEVEAPARRLDALALLAHLADAGRRTDGECLRLRNALEGCGAVLVTPTVLEAAA